MNTTWLSLSSPHLQVICWNPNLHVMVLRGIALWEVIRSWDWSEDEWDWHSYRKKGSDDFSLGHVRIQLKDGYLQTKNRDLTRHGYLILGLPSFLNCEKNKCFFKVTQSIVLLQQPKLTRTPNKIYVRNGWKISSISGNWCM